MLAGFFISGKGLPALARNFLVGRFVYKLLFAVAERQAQAVVCVCLQLFAGSSCYSRLRRSKLKLLFVVAELQAQAV